jgi:hypothetical protein
MCLSSINCKAISIILISRSRLDVELREEKLPTIYTPSQRVVNESRQQNDRDSETMNSKKKRNIKISNNAKEIESKCARRLYNVFNCKNVFHSADNS